MGWADAPPTAEELNPPWDSAPPTPEDLPGKSMGGFGMNVLKGIGSNLNPVNIAKGVGAQLKTGLYDLPKEAITDSANAVQNAAGAITGREDLKMPHIPLQEMVTEHPLVKDPAKFAYEKPVDLAMLAATPFISGLGGEGPAPEAAVPQEAAAALPKEPPVGEPPPAGAVPPETPPASAPGGTAPADPLQQVKDYVSQKYGAASAKPGFYQNVAQYLQNESRNLGGKDIRLQPRQIQSMGAGFEGTEKAGALIDYAREKGFLDPGLTDVARKAKVQASTAEAGQQVEALRAIADKRGAAPVQDIAQQVTDQLTKDYGVDAPGQIKKVLQKIQNADPTFSGMADLATELNKAKTPIKSMGQHPGPTTDAANIVSRINNDAIRGVLSPEEQAAYTDSLRNYGASKKLEQAVAGGERSAMSARSNQRGVFGRIWQEALDRGGYRVAGNIASRVSKSMLDNPAKVNTLPQFFEELAHHSNDVIDESLGIGEGMAHGGIVQEVGAHLESKYAKR